MSTVGMSQAQYQSVGKISGNPHCRKSELTTYRRSIDQANVKMHKAADAGDLELAMFWSNRIDEAQAKIHAIIEQEDNHSYKKSAVRTDAVKSTVDSADKAVNTAVKAAGAVAATATKLNLVA